VQSVRGIKNLKKYGLKNLQIDCVITKFNYKNLEENVKFFKKLGVDELHFTLMRIGGNAQKNLDKVFVPIKEIQPCLFKVLETGEKIGLSVKTCGFPYCLIRGFENHAYEINFLKTFSEEKTYVSDELFEEIDWQKERIAIKAKTETCRECVYFCICKGI